MPEDSQQPAQDPVEDEDAPAAAPDVKAAKDGPGAWTALAAPGKPDGEVDTRA